MRVPLTEKDLYIQLADVSDRYPRLKDDEDLVGHLLCFLSHLVKLRLQSSVEGCAR